MADRAIANGTIVLIRMLTVGNTPLALPKTTNQLPAYCLDPETDVSEEEQEVAEVKRNVPTRTQRYAFRTNIDNLPQDLQDKWHALEKSKAHGNVMDLTMAIAEH